MLFRRLVLPCSAATCAAIAAFLCLAVHGFSTHGTHATVFVESNLPHVPPSHWKWPGLGSPPSFEEVREIIAEKFISEGYHHAAALLIAEYSLKRAAGLKPDELEIVSEMLPEKDEYLSHRAHAHALLIRHFRKEGMTARDAGNAAGATLAGVAKHYGTNAYQASGDPPCETRLVYLRYCDEENRTRRHLTFIINDLWVHLSNACPLPDPVPVCIYPNVWWIKFTMPNQCDVIPAGATVHMEVPDESIYPIPCDDDLISWNCFGLTPQDPVDCNNFDYDCCPMEDGRGQTCLG